MNREGQFEVEIKPRDCYRHSVIVRQPGDTVSWTFATKKKNISFGLYYQLASDGTPSDDTTTGGEPSKKRTLGQSLSADTLKLIKTGSELLSRVPLDTQLSTDHVMEILRLAHPLVHISPPPKAGLTALNHSTDSLDHDGQPDSERTTDADLIPIVPVEKYSSSEATVSGSFDAPIAGTFVLVFDNTFSIHTSKQLTLCVSVRRHHEGFGNIMPSSVQPAATVIHGGWLLKRKRLRMQGFAKRWFKLDSTGLLTYHDDPEGPVKGGLNVRMCVITKLPPRLLMTLDSGTELFHLKALTDSDYGQWCDKIASVIHAMTNACDQQPVGPSTSQPIDHQDTMLLHQRILEHRISCTAAMEELKSSGNNNEKDAVIGKYLLRLEKTFAALNMFYNDVLLLEKMLTTPSAVAIKEAPTISITSPTVKTDKQLEEDVFYDAIIMEDLSEDERSLFGDIDESFVENLTIQESSLAPSVEDTTEAEQVQQQLAAGAQVVRLALPAPASPINVSYTSLIGQRMSGRNATTPVVLNEPLSQLQRQCEELEYVELLGAACRASTPVDRIANVAAFAVSCYSTCVHRYVYKPFTPMLGETFEWFDLVRGFRFVAEKVEHRPETILACHAESLDGKWTFWQEFLVRTKNWGKSVELTPGGFTHVSIKSDDDSRVYSYKWNKVTSCLRNILSNSCFIDNYGEMLVQSDHDDMMAKIDFCKSSTEGFFGATRTGRNEIFGSIVQKKRTLAKLSGRWDDYVAVDERVLWKAVSPPPNSTDYYGFSLFAMQLNVPPVLIDNLPRPAPTDSRFRPDQRLVEEGDIQSADLEKQRLEQKQRAKRAEREASGEEYEPLWFGRLEGGEYRFRGEYFEKREAFFPNCPFPDIF